MSEASELRLEVVNDNGVPVLVVVRVIEIVRVPLTGQSFGHLISDYQHAMTSRPDRGV